MTGWREFAGWKDTVSALSLPLAQSARFLFGSVFHGARAICLALLPRRGRRVGEVVSAAKSFVYLPYRGTGIRKAAI